MNNFLNSFVRIIENISEFFGKAVSWLTAVLVVLICVDVMLRYFFNTTKVWIIELEWHLFAFIFLIGAAYALKHDKHVRVDLFYTKFSTKEKAWINLIGSIVFLIPWCCIIIYYAFFFALDAYLIGEISPNPGGLPARFIVKGAIAIGLFLLLLQAFAETAKAILTIRGQSYENISHQHPNH